MTRSITLYITAPLAAEYRRRKDQHPTTAQILRAFPSWGQQVVSVPTAILMLEDARRQLEEFGDQLPSASRQNYRGLIMQIERRFDDLGEDEPDPRAAVDLRRVVALWKAPR